ncbi:WecB/TagA/CpsF family glycosyltransferase [Candidatus Parcubacteria bacterium]|jgi:N-acetylglucosaminyldiphosphoundecaprenol N-acetyl-beta-D-mannosaminyltransferase|nr:WecB/TagA/CpsF family glycosyltransferase [Candidatus Parcubacteria bacterium]
MKTYKLLGVKIQTAPEHVVKDTLHTFLNSDNQHQIVTVNPEFIVSAQKNKKFKNIINEASLSTIDGSGIIKLMQLIGHDISLEQRMTGVQLTEILLNQAINSNHKVLFCLYSKGLSKPNDFFISIKEKYPELDFQVADEKSALEKARIFAPHIILTGFGAPQQDIWIWENMHKIPSVKIGVGVGGTFDFISGRIKRAPKVMRSFGLEWLWRFLRQPWRLKRIHRAIFIFPWLVIKDRYLYKKRV